jgi:hypothetical protein
MPSFGGKAWVHKFQSQRTSSENRLGGLHSRRQSRDSTAVASLIASTTSWVKLWDMALDHGPHGTNALQALYHTLTRPRLPSSSCHVCESELDISFFEHLSVTCQFPIQRTSVTPSRMQVHIHPAFSSVLVIFYVMPYFCLALSALNMNILMLCCYFQQATSTRVAICLVVQ